MQTTMPMPMPQAQAPATAETMFADFAAYLDVKPATVRAYTSSARRFWLFKTGEGKGMQMRQAVMAWRAKLSVGRAPATVQNYMIGMRRFTAWAGSKGYISIQDAEAARAVKTPRPESKDFRKDCLTEAQARKLLASIDRASLAGKRNYAMLALMLTAGLRDIEVSRATLGNLQIKEGQHVLAVWGKGADGAGALVKVAPQVDAAIQEYLAARGVGDPAAPLFASTSNRNAHGQAMTTRSISRIVKGQLKAIGLDSPMLTAHSLRHTAATLNLEKGGSLEETQALLRHARITTTMIYNHHLKFKNRQAEARIADAVFA